MVAGFSTRHVAASAKRAGYEVYAIDHFCDRDLLEDTVMCRRFDELAELPLMIDEICKSHGIEMIVPTSGAENLQDLPVPVLGTPPAVADRFLDKQFIQGFFDRLNIPIPPLARKGVYPAMLKPARGSGGWRNTVVMSDDDVAAWCEQFPDEPYLLQEIVTGTPASVCCVANGKEARAIAVNRQIMRGEGVYRYGFCGSVTPFNHPLAGEMVRYAEAAAEASGCRGIMGVDFMVSDSMVYAIELNPRFVATLDTIEAATGLNLFSIHSDACRGILPGSMPTPLRYAIRRILFAKKPFRVSEDLGSLRPHVADVPVPPADFEEGSAVISIFGTGPDEASAELSLDTTIRVVREYIQ